MWLSCGVGRLSKFADALLGRSAYQAPPPGVAGQLDLESAVVERIRRYVGGQIQPQTYSQQRWYLDDLETAVYAADGGDMSMAARLMRAARMDGTLAGVLSTRTGGLVRLPKRFRGNGEVISELEIGHDSVRSVFDEMFPPSELEKLAADGELLGVGVAELVPVAGRGYPVMVRLDPEFLYYRWSENRWYFKSIGGLIAITPGDGRWILHTPGGRMAPWQHGLWRAIGRAFIRKEHAALHKDNWEAKLANPARVAVAPSGAAQEQQEAWFQRVLAWGVNTVFGMTPGYDVKLIESNGRGFESFNLTIAQCNTEMIIAVAGQTVTTDGGAGFQNSDIHKSIRADLIKATADGLAYTINTQGIPAFIALRFGAEVEDPDELMFLLDERATVMEWDVTPPKDRNSEASSMVTAANAIKTLKEALINSDRVLDVGALCTRYGIPITHDADGDGHPDAIASGDKPNLRLIAGGKNEAGDGLVPASTGDNAEDSALNGAQVASLLEIVQAVAIGSIPRDSGVAMIKRAFLVDDAGAEALMGSVGKGFVPTNAAQPSAPSTDAPEPPPSAADEAAA